MVSLGMFASYALSIARRSRGFIAGSAPPRRAATVTSLISRVKILPFLASAAAFLCFTLAHLECPDMRRAARYWVGKVYNFGMYPLTASNFPGTMLSIGRLIMADKYTRKQFQAQYQ